MSSEKKRGSRCTTALALLALALCSACATAPLSRPPQSGAALPDYMHVQAELESLAGGRLFRVDASASQVHIHVFRAGRAVALGHNHVLTAPRVQGLLWWPWDEPGQRLALRGAAAARFELMLRLDELELDPPELRATLGPGWASLLSPEAVAATRRNMLGEDGLQAQRFPELRIQGLQLLGEAPKLIGRWLLQLHGQTRLHEVPLHVQMSPQGVSVRGAFFVRQSDFGLTPFSVGGGLLAVQDELLIEFVLQGR